MPKPFRFKQFDIIHDDSQMKVGTDAVLLGAWSDISDARQILDIGAGSGVITLMMAQKCKQAEVIGVEIDEKAAREASLNVQNSPWSERMKIIQADICEFQTTKRFDVIISNPPYFQDGLESPEQSRANVRHARLLTRERLLKSVNDLLAKDGHFFTILPHQGHEFFVDHSVKTGLFVHHLTQVFPHKNKSPHRVLLKLSRVKDKRVDDTLYLHEVGQRGYSDELLDLTKDFYLYVNSKP